MDATIALDLDLYDLDVNFVLTADHNPVTGQLENGYLKITGDFNGTGTRDSENDNGIPVVTLFESNDLTAWSACTTDLFQFTFTEQGTTPVVHDGHTIGIILDGQQISQFRDAFDNPVDPHFDVDFNNGGLGKADIYFFPEPGTLALMALGALGLARRWRH